MGKESSLKTACYKSKLFLKRASPTILSFVAAGGVVATAILAVKATPKALNLLEEASYEKEETLSKIEVIRVAGPVYIPSVLTGLSTIACIAGVNVLNRRNQASLASAYAMLSQSYRHYRKAANDIYGGDADSKIIAQMAKDTYVSADGYSVYTADMDEASEKILCYDLFARRYFTSTMASVLNAQYHINRNLCLRGYVSVNEFYEFLGIDKIEHGEDIGWSMDELMEGGIMWLDFNNSFAKMDDGMECCIVNALWEPNKFSVDM